ncbi:MAG: translocation/assembly module TamB domain-containing protein, partial [Spirochaetia bacterium]
LSAQGHVTLRSPDGAESYSAAGGLKDGTLSLTGRFAGSPLARISTSAVKGVLEGTSSLTGSVRQPAAVVMASLKDGRLGTDNLSLGAQVTVLPDAIQVSHLVFGYLSHAISDGTGTVNTKTGAFSFKGSYAAEYFADQVKLTAGLDGQFAAGSLDSLVDTILDHGLKGRLALSGITVAGAAVPAWGVDFRSDAGRLSFDGGPGSSLHGWIDSRRSFSVSLANPLPLSGSVVGRIAGDHITATLNVDALQMVVLNSLLKSPPVPNAAEPVPVIRVTAGVASGRLTIDGPVNDPDFTGQLNLAGGGIICAYSPEEAGPIRDALVFTGKTFRAPRTFANAGKALLSAEASFTIDHWSPVAFDIAINTVGDSPLRMRGKFGRLTVDGSASGQVRIVGDERKTNVTGDLQVGDCKIALGDFTQGKFVPEDTPTFVTLTAETGKRVEFYWPTENLPVLRATAIPGGTIAVTYRGDTGAYTVKGNAGIQGGEIYYFDRSFNLKKGLISFNEDQSRFDPRITANAEAREWDPFTGEEVKIFLDSDSALSKFSPRLSSVPARSQTALLAMIGAPIMTATETQGPVMAAALMYSDILSQTWLLRPFEQRVRQVLNLDMFSVRTQILQNLVAQKLFGTALNPLDNTSVSLGKYVGNDLFWEMLVRLQSPPLPTGAPLPPSSLQPGQFQTGVTQTSNGLPLVGTGLQPALELSLEWATPLFLLTWSWVPQHPESLFLVDNSLAFSWRFTY